MRVEQAIIEFGSVAHLAAALSISVQAVYQWGDKVPPLREYQIRELLAMRQGVVADLRGPAAVDAENTPDSREAA